MLHTFFLFTAWKSHSIYFLIVTGSEHSSLSRELLNSYLEKMLFSMLYTFLPKSHSVYSLILGSENSYSFSKEFYFQCCDPIQFTLCLLLFTLSLFVLSENRSLSKRFFI